MGQRTEGCAVLGFLDLFVIASVAPGVRIAWIKGRVEAGGSWQISGRER